MSKRLMIMLTVLVSLLTATTLLAGDEAFAGAKDEKSTPIQFSLFPNIQLPGETNVHGLALGIVQFETGDYHVIGCSAGLFADLTNNVRGASFGFVNVAEFIQGYQGGFLNITDELQGLQGGLFNWSKSKGSKKFGLQIGLINIMEDGFLPFFPFFNFTTSKE